MIIMIIIMIIIITIVIIIIIIISKFVECHFPMVQWRFSRN